MPPRTPGRGNRSRVDSLSACHETRKQPFQRSYPSILCSIPKDSYPCPAARLRPVTCWLQWQAPGTASETHHRPRDLENAGRFQVIALRAQEQQGAACGCEEWSPLRGEALTKEVNQATSSARTASASRATEFNPLRRIEGLPTRLLPLRSPLRGDFPTCRRTTDSGLPRFPKTAFKE